MLSCAKQEPAIIQHLPLASIDRRALPRDRSTLDPRALADLQTLIATSGLRQPFEVWRLSTRRENDGPSPFDDGLICGLISGLRRLTDHHNCATLRGNDDFTAIPACIPATLTEALSLMVEENAARTDLSP